MAEELKNTTPAEGETVTKPAAKKAKGKISRVRGIVVLVAFLLIVIGLLVGNGWGTYSSMGIGALAAICPLGALETLVAGHSPVLRTIISLVCVLAVIALVGRLFCAWGCPVPPLRRFFRPNADRKAAKKTEASAQTALTEEEKKGLELTCSADKKAGKGSSCGDCSSCGLPPVGGKRDGIHIDSRHGMLIGALLSSAIFGFPVFCLICPVGLSIAFVIGIYRAIFQQDPTLSLLIFAGIILIEVVLFRKWCHKLCPIGALMSLVGAKAPLFKPRVKEAKCLRTQGIDCRACVNACPEELDPHCSSLSECTRCGQCVEACPAGAVTMRTFGCGSKAAKSAPAISEGVEAACSEELEPEQEPVA